MKRRYYYHITTTRILSQPVPCGRHNIICVSPSIAQCLAALYMHQEKRENYYVWRTLYKVYAAAPEKPEYDIHITGERHIKERIAWKFLGVLASEDLPMPLGRLYEHKPQRFFPIDITTLGMQRAIKFFQEGKLFYRWKTQ